MINIQDIIPLMKDGWVAMDSDNEWYWFEDRPIKNMIAWDSQFCDNLSMFDIAPADDWTKSLIKIKGVKTR